jgi:hypothetical protein
MNPLNEYLKVIKELGPEIFGGGPDIQTYDQGAYHVTPWKELVEVCMEGSPKVQGKEGSAKWIHADTHSFHEMKDNTIHIRCPHCGRDWKIARETIYGMPYKTLTERLISVGIDPGSVTGTMKNILDKAAVKEVV